MRVVAGLCVLMLVGMSGCSSSNSATGPSGNVVHACGGGNASGSMTASISGRSFEAECLVTITFNGKIFDLTGTDVSQNNATNFQIVGFAVTASGPGTYTLDSSTSPSGNGNNASYTIGGNQQWVSGAGFGGGGTITLDKLSATGASGTFSINFVAGPGGSGTKTLTNGKFNVTF